MGELVRAGERRALGALWPVAGRLFGWDSPNEHYRQALWSPFKQKVGDAALSSVFCGVEGLSGEKRRSWKTIGVIAVREGALDELLKQPGARPAVAFRASETRLVVGELADPNGFGHLKQSDGSEGDIAHGLRIGPGDIQFALGVTMPGEGFITPPARYVETLGTLYLPSLRPDTRFANVNFS